MKNQIDNNQFEELLKSLKDIEDPRVTGRCSHNIVDILVISIFAVICGAESIKDILVYAKSKEAWLKKFLELPNGIPSKDTISRVLSMIKSESIESAFTSWVGFLISNKQVKTLSLDGKSTKGTALTFNQGPKGLTTVSAYSHEYGLSITEKEVSNKGISEPKIGEQCLDNLELEGTIILADAAYSTKGIVNKIISNKGGYILPIKRNNRKSLGELQTHFKNYKGQKNTTKEKGHGRQEHRQCRVLSASKLSDYFKQRWPGVESVLLISRDITTKDKRYFIQKRDEDGKNYYEKNDNMGGLRSCASEVYYVSSEKLTAAEFLEKTRSHWEIENKLHWVLDVAFREDAWKVRAKVLARRLSLIRKFGYNFIKSANVKDSVRATIKRAGWDNDFFEKIILKRF